MQHLFSIISRGTAVVFSEILDKAALVGKPGFLGNLGNLFGCVGKQLFCLEDPVFRQVLGKGDSCVLLEKAAEVFLGEEKLLCHLGGVERLAIMLVNVR